MNRLLPAFDKSKGSKPTFFELMTAMAFLYFDHKKVDIAVIEAGLGGRLDGVWWPHDYTAAAARVNAAPAGDVLILPWHQYRAWQWNEDRTVLQPWDRMISPDEYVSVVSSVNTPSITNWRFASLKAKDAIVDRVASVVGRRPDSGSKRDHFVVHLYWKDDFCQLFVNTSGRKLADRGYRKMPHKAPMQETLAAGVILATGYDGSAPLVNPMCGSGTLAIEAALIASGRPPGLLRSNFGFMHYKGFDADAWQAMRREAKKIRSAFGGPPAPILATDVDPEAVRAAKKNAETAGVHHMIDFAVCDFAETCMPQDKGIVILNPEYGERLGEVSELESTYKSIGGFFKQNCPGWTGYIFTGNMSLAKKVGLRASRRFEFYNAKIECRLLKYELYEGTRRTPE
ncbi:MAG: class I SAM-dependent RNA methyltransferase [Planctomycetes bacterium]|nr:class I SAM-dependent RNA methyltransferase [Planctomycetota bacterium]